MDIFLRESFARQMMWMSKYINNNWEKIGNLRNKSKEDILKILFDSKMVGIRLFIFNCEAEQKFGNFSYLQTLEN